MWIEALLIDAGCLYIQIGKRIKANGKFGKKLGKALKERKTPTWKMIANRYKWHWQNNS